MVSWYIVNWSKYSWIALNFSKTLKFTTVNELTVPCRWFLLYLLKLSLFLPDSSVSSICLLLPPTILKNHSFPVLRSQLENLLKPPLSPMGRLSFPGYGFKLVRTLHDGLPYMEGLFSLVVCLISRKKCLWSCGASCFEIASRLICLPCFSLNQDCKRRTDVLVLFLVFSETILSLKETSSSSV